VARKPAIVVPNHMLEQFSREFLQLYPQAKVLVTQRDDLQAGRRRQFIGRCATGDWDAVIMSRSAFERIPMSAQAQRDYLDAELDRMREFIQASKEGDGPTSASPPSPPSSATSTPRSAAAPTPAATPSP
jgi:N12 class adenine-specific DNA methylase